MKKYNDLIKKNNELNFDNIIKLYNLILDEFPKVLFVNNDIISYIDNIKNIGFDLEKIKILFETVKNSDFLCGKNKNGWTANFEWILKNAVNIINGKYNKSLKVKNISTKNDTLRQKQIDILNQFYINDCGKDKFKYMILVLSQEYNIEFSLERIKIWYNILKDYDIEQVSFAVYEVIKKNTYSPKISDIIEVIKSIETEKNEEANLAWEELKEELKSGKCEKNIISVRTVDMMGGCKNLSMINIKQLNFLKNKFLSIYKNIKLKDEFNLKNKEKKELTEKSTYFIS